MFKSNLFFKMLFFWGLSFITIYSSAQFSRYFIDSEQRLKQLYDSLFLRDNVRYLLPDEEKISLNNQIINEWKQILSTENAFDYPFSSINNAGILISPDSLVKIITWNIRFKNGSYRYFGFILHRQQRTDNYSRLFELIDYSDSLDDKDLENLTLKYNRWYGANYYQISQYSYKAQTFYVLIGWDGYSNYINRKVVEILYFNKKGIPIFGKNVFISPVKKVSRLIFNHSIKASMTCTYDAKLNAIVFDHLVPSSSIYKDMYEFYGPNGTYDAYFLKKNVWIYKEDIEPRNPPSKN